MLTYAAADSLTQPASLTFRQQQHSGRLCRKLLAPIVAETQWQQQHQQQQQRRRQHESPRQQRNLMPDQGLECVANRTDRYHSIPSAMWSAQPDITPTEYLQEISAGYQQNTCRILLANMTSW